jgi:hypothetical protein
METQITVVEVLAVFGAIKTTLTMNFTVSAVIEGQGNAVFVNQLAGAWPPRSV